MGASTSSSVTVDGFPMGPVLRRWGRAARTWARVLLWPLDNVLAVVAPTRSTLVAQALAAPELPATERLEVLSAVEDDRAALTNQLSDLASRLAELKHREAKLEAHLSEVTQVKTSCNDALNELSRRQEELNGAVAPTDDDAVSSSASFTLDTAKLESARDAVTRATEMQDTVAAQLIQLRDERRRLGDKLWDLDNERASLEASLAPVQAAEDKALTQSALLAEGGGAEEVDVDAEERTQS